MFGYRVLANAELV